VPSEKPIGGVAVKRDAADLVLSRSGGDCRGVLDFLGLFILDSESAREYGFTISILF
jgi:hypothetical protein